MVNLYEYIGDKPLMWTDPWGLRPAAPYEYVPGAVNVQIVGSQKKPTWIHNDPDLPGDFSSHFQLYAVPVPSMFIYSKSSRNNCGKSGEKGQYCDLIGYVQIEKSALNASGLFGGLRTWADTHDWRIDVHPLSVFRDHESSDARGDKV